MEIGFIGLGKMGFPMARRLIEAKHQLTVFDTRKEAVDQLTASARRRHRRRRKSPTAAKPYWRACRRYRPRLTSRRAQAA